MWLWLGLNYSSAILYKSDNFIDFKFGGVERRETEIRYEPKTGKIFFLIKDEVTHTSHTFGQRLRSFLGAYSMLSRSFMLGPRSGAYSNMD